MYTGNEKDQKVSKFITNLYNILKDRIFSDYITWSDDGTYFKIKDVKLFEKKVCPEFFKHGRYTSF